MRRRKCPLQSAIVVVVGYRTKMLMKKICRRAKNRESRHRQHLGAAENLAARLKLGIVM